MDIAIRLGERGFGGFEEGYEMSRMWFYSLGSRSIGVGVRVVIVIVSFVWFVLEVMVVV